MKVASILTCALAAFGLPNSADGSAAAGAALKALKSMDYRFFVAGGTCAAFSHGITCPIDVVKVRYSTQLHKCIILSGHVPVLPHPFDIVLF